MQCDSCGRNVVAESVYCPHCGARLAGGAAAAQHDGAWDDSHASDDGPSGAERLQGRRSGGKHPAEEELWSGSYSPKAMVGPALALGVVSIAALAAGVLAGPPGLVIAVIGVVAAWILLGLTILYRRMTVHYRLTTYRFYHETGLMSRTRNRIEVIDINDVTLKQGLLERMLGVGTVEILSSDVTDSNLKLHGIEDVRRVTDLIDDTRRAERRRRGVFMENIGGMPAM